MIELSTDAVDIRVKRQRAGIGLIVKVQPEVEAFFEHWSGGQNDKPAHGRLWTISDGPLLVWSTGALQLGPGSMRPYTLVHAGAGPYVDNFPNISFLRLVGASQPEGRKIIINVPVGRTELATWLQRAGDACNQFHSEYLLDVNMRAVVSLFRMPTAA